MSILNKMHKELQHQSDEPHLLSTASNKKRKQKALMLSLISLLVASSLGLLYLIYSDEKNTDNVSDASSQQEMGNTDIQTVNDMQAMPVSPTPTVTVTPILVEEKVNVISNTTPIVPEVVVTPIPVVKSTPAPIKKIKVAPTTTPKKREVKKATAVVSSNKAANSKTEVKKSGHLEITASKLTKAERADIHINNAQKALANDDLELAAKEKSKALSIRPELHEVRKSLALYYYGLGEQGRAGNVLKKGARAFPEYADYSLMLSRIALKSGDQQKAYLYLDQSPPKVQGNLDYHVSYAILAQKFKHYKKSEVLYQGLLTQRPTNGRWMMSLAIAQDKQGKESLAVKNYQQALLQVDLSSNAKKYINQRLTYLANK